MPHYRLIFTDPRMDSPESISFVGRDAGQALLLAQKHEGPVELWAGDKHLCTLRQSGNEGRFWIISKEEPHAPANQA